MPDTLGWGEGAEAELTPGEKLEATVIKTVRGWQMADTGQCNRKGPINTSIHKPPWQFTGDRTVCSTDIYMYLDACLTLCIEFNSKWIIDQNVKPKNLIIGLK